MSSTESILARIPCSEVSCPERADCCTTVRWRISDKDFSDRRFREWWLLHEEARMYREDGVCYIQWPMRCRNVSPDGLRCMAYDDRPDICRGYACRRMAGEEPAITEYTDARASGYGENHDDPGRPGRASMDEP